MTDTLTTVQRSERMARVRSRDTKPEQRVRSFLHAAGFRYRLQRRVEGIRPDLLFATRRVALFVHGCIWHRHPDPACPFTRTPKSRVAFWEAKFAENIARDARQKSELEAAGWRVIIIWECETRHADRLTTLATQLRAIPKRAESRKGSTSPSSLSPNQQLPILRAPPLPPFGA